MQKWRFYCGGGIRSAHDCAEYGREFKKCSCVIQAEGLLPGYGGYKCLSTATRIMAEAERMVFYAEQCGSWDKGLMSGLPLNMSLPCPSPNTVLAPALTATAAVSRTRSVKEAIQKFLSELDNPKTKKREAATISKYKTLMNRMQTFCEERGLTELSQVRLEELMDFRDSWPTGARATENDINRLRMFYRFCIGLKWVEENLAKRLAHPNAEDTQVQRVGA
jgi:hypothetical protein